MSDNVIILGAGASRAAGIPLLGGFMDQMWQMAKLGHHLGTNLADADRTLLEKAIEVTLRLDSYHGRAALDTWNLEEVLSLLSFNVLAGGDAEKAEFLLMTRAIAKTVELTCQFEHNGKVNDPSANWDTALTKTKTIYCRFWQSLFDWCSEKQRSLPIIISFNYDLVMERSLLYTMTDSDLHDRPLCPYRSIAIDYHTRIFDPLYLQLKETFFTRVERHNLVSSHIRTNGQYIDVRHDSKEFAADGARVSILKLHGSTNFPRVKRNPSVTINSLEGLVIAQEDPLILPPVFNKAMDSVGSESWAFALSALRKCKNLIICGYSLPKTDIYMQYFLKAALGPNHELSRIFVFDPTLFGDEQKSAGDALKERYCSNFSPPIQKRIEFTPGLRGSVGELGTFAHMVHCVENAPDMILFG